MKLRHAEKPPHIPMETRPHSEKSYYRDPANGMPSLPIPGSATTIVTDEYLYMGEGGRSQEPSGIYADPTVTYQNEAMVSYHFLDHRLMRLSPTTSEMSSDINV